MSIRVKITLAPGARRQALEMRAARGLETPENFEGPDFENVKDVSVDSTGVWVLTEDSVEYFYPMVTVARVAQYKE